MIGNKQLLMVGSALLATGAFWAAQSTVLGPHERQMTAAQTRLQEERELLEVQRELAALLPAVEQYQARLPAAPSSEWLVGEVSRLVAQERLRLVSIEPEPLRQMTAGATRLAVSVRLEGRFHDVGRLVSQLESSPTYMHVDELDVRPTMTGTMPRAAADGASQLGEIRMVISTMHAPPLAALGETRPEVAAWGR